MERGLGARLLCVAKSIPVCRTLVDCGCDHGYVSIYAAENGIAQKITASDINRGPLDNAEKEIAASGQKERITTVLTDGLDGLSPHECVVIAGMGGETIAEIISRAPWTKQNCTLVLQPMTRSEVLREYLYNEGFEITDENIVFESGHMYCIIVAKHSGNVVYEPFEKYISRAALKKELAGEYFGRVISRLSYELERKTAAGAISKKEKQVLQRELLSLCKMRDRL